MENKPQNILFVMPDERELYEASGLEVGSYHVPSLAFAILGAISKENNYSPTILDLSIEKNPKYSLKQHLTNLKPKYVGITCTSATYYQAIIMSKIIRMESPETKILVGGTHVSSLVNETLESNCFDYVFVGESDISLGKFLRGDKLEYIDGIAYKDEYGKIHFNPNKSFLKNLDDFPFPDYSLYDLSRYHVSKLHAKNNPVVWIETSRGCPFDCKICNKVVHGQTFRPKSTERVIAEIEYFLSLGVKELHVSDDGFTSNINRAEEICDEIIKKKLKFSWNCSNGIRVDRVNLELLKKMKKAGCYRISFGIESGNQKVLDNLGKKVTLDQVRNAVKMARKAGLQVYGFFIIGFEDDTEETMQDTINFAKSLPLELAKAGIMMPFPGSPLYYKYKSLNLIFPTKDYRNFNTFISPELVYTHPSLDWDTIKKYEKKFYSAFYFNFSYIFRRFISSLKNKTLFSDIRTLIIFKIGNGLNKLNKRKTNNSTGVDYHIKEYNIELLCVLR